MEPASESRFDPNFAPQILLEIAHEQSSLENLRLLNLIRFSGSAQPLHVQCSRPLERVKIGILLRWPLAQAAKPYIWSIALSWIAASLLVTGCCSISTTHTQDICGPRFAPSDPSQVVILPNVPARPHIELGQVWAYSTSASENPSKLEQVLRKEAAKLGADAFVIWHDGIQTGDPALFPANEGRSVKKVPGRTVIGAAIKYP